MRGSSRIHANRAALLGESSGSRSEYSVTAEVAKNLSLLTEPCPPMSVGEATKRERKNMTSGKNYAQKISLGL